MEFRILGPLEVSDAGRELSIRGPKLQALLALLLLHGGEVVSRDRLIEDLWAGDPPPTAAKTLGVHVSRLRRELGDHVLVTRAGGYAIEVEPGALDLQCFEALVADGRAALADGRPRDAEEHLRAALALWRGPPFPELNEEPFARIESGRLEQIRLDAIEDRIAAELSLGRHARAVEELEALVAHNPYREEPRALLMLALYRAGRQADALDAYRRARGVLVEELGVEPGPRLRELHDAILAQDPALDAGERPAAAPPAVPLTSSAPPAASARPPPARGGRGRGRAALLAGGLVLAAALVLVALVGGEDEEGPVLTADSHAVVAIDPNSNEVESAASVGSRPGPLAYEPRSRSLWVANVDDRSVTRVDTRPLRVGRTIAVGETPGGVAAAAGKVWVATANRAKPFVTLREMDTRFDAHAGSVRIAASPEGSADVTRAGERLWVAPLLGLLTQVDPRTGDVARPGIDPGGLAPSAVAGGGGAIWVVDKTGNTVSRVDTDSGAATSIPVGNGPAGIAIGAGSVWVTLRLEGTVVQIDPESGAVRDTIPVGRRPAGVALGEGSVWIANSGDGTVSRIDPSSGRVSATISVGAAPQDVAVGGDRVWVSVRPRVVPEAARPGATIRVVAGPQTGPEQLSLDPALGYTPLSWQVQYAAGAKLLNYPDQPGQTGSRVRPEVAAAPPVRSADGLTYTFRIRPGYRFSPPSGEDVTARSFKYAIERSFHPRMHGPARTFAIPIAGVREFAAGRARHIAGVEATGDTLTIRLTRPLDDFPTWMAMPFFAAIPTDTPIEPDGVRAVPSAGPYYVASQASDESIVLRRNPNYEGPRPRRAAEIRIQVPLGPEQAVARVEAGSADYATEAITRPLARRLAARYGGRRYRIDRQLATDYLLFNAASPAFDSVRTRRAVNLAIDRRALARAGGIWDGLPARPTDQYLPPGMPGFADARVYRLHPNLRRARALAGSRRRVVRLYTPKGAPTERLAAIVKANLHAIGMEVQVTTVNSFERFGVPGEPWDLALISWYADRPDPLDFLGHFDSRNIQSGQSLNLSGFADPDYDRRIDRANALTGAERYLAFGRLDARLARTAAPYAAFSNEARHSFFSDRVGCQIYHPVYGINLAALCIRDDRS